MRPWLNYVRDLKRRLESTPRESIHTDKELPVTSPTVASPLISNAGEDHAMHSDGSETPGVPIDSELDVADAKESGPIRMAHSRYLAGKNYSPHISDPFSSKTASVIRKMTCDYPHAISQRSERSRRTVLCLLLPACAARSEEYGARISKITSIRNDCRKEGFLRSIGNEKPRVCATHALARLVLQTSCPIAPGGPIKASGDTDTNYPLPLTSKTPDNTTHGRSLGRPPKLMSKKRAYAFGDETTGQQETYLWFLLQYEKAIAVARE